jgi:hypothetical protein
MRRDIGRSKLIPSTSNCSERRGNKPLSLGGEKMEIIGVFPLSKAEKQLVRETTERYDPSLEGYPQPGARWIDRQRYEYVTASSYGTYVVDFSKKGKVIASFSGRRNSFRNGCCLFRFEGYSDYPRKGEIILLSIQSNLGPLDLVGEVKEYKTSTPEKPLRNLEEEGE